MSDQPTFQPSMFSAEDSPVRMSQSQENALDSLVTVLASGTSSTESSLNASPVGWSSRTSLASCHHNGGRDMGAILGALGNDGYGFAYRVLDAQWFGVAQRRRRVFIVGHLGGNGGCEVLAVGQGSAGDPPPSRSERQVTPTLSGSGAKGYSNVDAAGFLAPATANTLTSRMAKGVNSDLNEGQTVVPFTQNTRDEVRVIGEAEGTHVAGALAAQEGTKQRTYLAIAYDSYNSQAHDEIVPTMGANTGTATGRAGVVGFMLGQSAGAGSLGDEYEMAPTLRAGQSGTQRAAISSATTLRRLTPVECARLQGFPDGWNDHLSDTARYKQYGNAVAVPVAEWLMGRIVVWPSKS